MNMVIKLYNILSDRLNIPVFFIIIILSNVGSLKYQPKILSCNS